MTELIEREIPATGRTGVDTRSTGREASRSAGANGLPRTRTPEEYEQCWNEFYESARSEGRGTNIARWMANEALMRLRATDDGRELLGSRDIETYF